MICFNISLFLTGRAGPPVTPGFVISDTRLNAVAVSPFSFGPSGDVFVPLEYGTAKLSMCFLLTYSGFSTVSISTIPGVAQTLLSHST